MFDSREKLFARSWGRESANAALTFTIWSGGQGYEVKGGFFIGMGLLEGFDGRGESVEGKDGFEAEFINTFELIGLANGGVRTLLTEEGSSSGRPEGAGGVVANVAGPGIEESGGNRFGGIGRDKDDKFIVRGCGSIGAKGLAIDEAQHVSQHVIGAAVGDIEGGVWGVNGQTTADGVMDEGWRGDAFEGIEDGRMVSEDGITMLLMGFGSDLSGVVDGQEELVDFLSGIPNEQANVVPRFGVPQGSEIIENAE